MLIKQCQLWWKSILFSDIVVKSKNTNKTEGAGSFTAGLPVVFGHIVTVLSLIISFCLLNYLPRLSKIWTKDVIITEVCGKIIAIAGGWCTRQSLFQSVQFLFFGLNSSYSGRVMHRNARVSINKCLFVKRLIPCFLYLSLSAFFLWKEIEYGLGYV